MAHRDRLPQLLRTVRLSPSAKASARRGAFGLTTVAGRRLADVEPLPPGRYAFTSEPIFPLRAGPWQAIVFDERGRLAGRHVLVRAGDGDPDNADPATYPADWAMMVVAWSLSTLVRGQG